MKPAPNGKKAAPKRQKRRVRPGNLPALQRLLWRSLTAAEEALEAAHADRDRALVLKSVHAISTAAGAYLRATEAAELLPRIEALEAAMQERRLV